MTNIDDQIPTRGEWRGVPLHDGQSEERLRVVRADIDAAHVLRDLPDLFEFLQAPRNAPEARLFARAKAEATLDDATERRAPRDRNAAISRELIRAATAGLTSLKWQCRTHYCSRLDRRHPPGQPDGRVRRETPLE